MKKKALLVLGAALLTGVAWFMIATRPHLPEPPPPARPTRPVPPPAGKPPAGFHTPKVSRISTADPSPQRPEPGLPTVPNIPPGVSHSILESLALITDNGPGAPYRERIEAVHRLGKDLPAEQVRILMDFIAAPLPPGTAEVEFRRIGAIKNEALDTILAQQSLPEGIGDLLISMAANPVLDDLWRDYCIQRFVPYYDRKYPESTVPEAGHEAEAPARARFLAACWSHATGPVTERTGTALLSLERLASRHAEIDRQTLARTALAVAASGEAPASARIPALQVAARLGEGKAAALARELVEGPVTTTLKLSALATLGEAGGSEDLPLLARVLEGGGKHLHKAATEAKAKIERRLNAAGNAP